MTINNDVRVNWDNEDFPPLYRTRNFHLEKTQSALDEFLSSKLSEYIIKSGEHHEKH